RRPLGALCELYRPLAPAPPGDLRGLRRARRRGAAPLSAALAPARPGAAAVGLAALAGRHRARRIRAALPRADPPPTLTLTSAQGRSWCVWPLRPFSRSTWRAPIASGLPFQIRRRHALAHSRTHPPDRSPRRGPGTAAARDQR